MTEDVLGGPGFPNLTPGPGVATKGGGKVRDRGQATGASSPGLQTEVLFLKMFCLFLTGIFQLRF